jgi:light-regulated signal transduction histidine kinase (bacteriophytochrome)
MNCNVANLPKEILIVDDTPSNLQLLSIMLTKQGYKVRKATNGQMALRSVQAAPPDLILLDIKMPHIDGYETCRCLKVNHRTSEIPIIFVSVLDDAVDKVKAFTVGGADYITKPFQEAEVIARIENQLRLQQLQKQLIEQNTQLQQLNQELLHSNQELEQFAYAVSHDLQQPLLSITGFVKLIFLKYQNSLNPDVLNCLERIESAGSRMQQFIQDLLTYAQADKHSQELQLIDCNLVIGQVLDSLQVIISENQAEITCDTLPRVMGNLAQLFQLFQNLISNAVKFHRSDVSPQIKISAKLEDRFWLLSVQDNGIGISSRDLEHIFELFHRVHHSEEYPGSGLGLATCKKIVERFDGRIWIESQLHVGTTVYFTFPAVEHS